VSAPDPESVCECGRKFGDHLFSVRNGLAKCGAKQADKLRQEAELHLERSIAKSDGTGKSVAQVAYESELVFRRVGSRDVCFRCGAGLGAPFLHCQCRDTRGFFVELTQPIRRFMITGIRCLECNAVSTDGKPCPCKAADGGGFEFL